MLKIAVITRHAITNYGSLLQAMATQKVFEGLGFDCEIIDYVRTQENYRNIEKSLLKTKKEWNNSLLKKSLYLLLRQPESLFAGKRFEMFRLKYLKLSERYTNLEELKERPPEADLYVTGSDQVWGPVEDGTYDEAYTLSFTKEKKISFAASFGHAELTDSTRTYYKNRLTEYSHITVREDSAVVALRSIGIESRQILDPTLILNASFWNRLLKPIKMRKYILVYQIHNNKKLDRYAKNVSKLKGLPLVRVSAYFHQIVRPGRLVLCPEVDTFLSYIKNAECLITDSFHGTTFAINFNIPFVEILPNNNTETRNKNILNLTGLSDRILDNEEDYELVDKKIDYSYTNNILELERKKSLRLLEKMISE